MKTVQYYFLRVGSTWMIRIRSSCVVVKCIDAYWKAKSIPIFASWFWFNTNTICSFRHWLFAVKATKGKFCFLRDASFGTFFWWWCLCLTVTRNKQMDLHKCNFNIWNCTYHELIRIESIFKGFEEKLTFIWHWLTIFGSCLNQVSRLVSTNQNGWDLIFSTESTSPHSSLVLRLINFDNFRTTTKNFEKKWSDTFTTATHK